MKKKLFAFALSAVVAMSALVGCGSSSTTPANSTKAEAESKKTNKGSDPADYKVVMIVKQSDSWFDDMASGIDQLKKDTGLNVSVQVPEKGDAASQISIMEDFGIGVAGPVKKVFNRNQRETMFLTDRFLFYLTDTFGQTQIYTISFQYDPEHVKGVIERDKD